MELVVGFAEARISRLMGQVVDPTALELDVVVDLVDHLLELSSVNAIGAHISFLSL